MADLEVFDRAVQRMKEQREVEVAEGKDWTCDLFVCRDGDEDTSLDIVLIPGPVMMDDPDFKAEGDSVDTRRMALTLASIAIPGFGADWLILCTDSYCMPSGNRAEERRRRRRLDDFQGSMNVAVQAGAKEELGIQDAMVALLVERPKSPDLLGRVSQRVLSYEIDGGNIHWREDRNWSLVDDGQSKNGMSSGYVVDALRVGFTLPDLSEAAQRQWASLGNEPEDYLLARASVDLVVMRVLAETGAIVLPMVPAGPRADYMESRLKSFAENEPRFRLHYGDDTDV